MKHYHISGFPAGFYIGTFNNVNFFCDGHYRGEKYWDSLQTFPHLEVKLNCPVKIFNSINEIRDEVKKMGKDFVIEVFNWIMEGRRAKLEKDAINKSTVGAQENPSNIANE